MKEVFFVCGGFVVSVRIDVEHNDEKYVGSIETVSDVSLGWNDMGIFTMSLTFREGNSYQGTPAHFLTDQGKGTAYGLGFIIETMKAVGVEDFNELRGKQAIVLRSYAGGFIDGVASLDGTSVFVFKEL